MAEEIEEELEAPIGTLAEGALQEDYSKLDLEKFIRNATWKELLVELVASDKLDPWNIDISKVVDGYIATVKKMQFLDLHVPANIILAASILLRMKSETLSVFDAYEEAQEDDMEQVTLSETGERVYPEVPALTPRIRIQPNKRITLMELMRALDDVIKIKERRESMIQTAMEPLKFVINEDDINAKIERVYESIAGMADREGMTTFSYLTKDANRDGSMLLDLFVPLLFLATKNRIIMMQEEFFGEIIIKRVREKEGKAAKKAKAEEAEEQHG